MSVLDTNDIRSVFEETPDYRDALVLPSDLDYGGLIATLGAETTEAEWNALPWTVKKGVSPKPTWGALKVLVQERAVDKDIETAEQFHRLHKFVPLEFTDAPHVTVDGKRLHIGTGADHLTGMLALLEQATQAGEHLPLVTLRDDQHRPHAVYLTSSVRALWSRLARQKNAAESAHNTTIRQYFDLQAKAEDRKRPLKERAKAAAELRAFSEHYVDHLKRAVAAYNPEALPADLAELKLVLCERIEAAAMRQVKAIKGAVSQQGVDLPESCADEARALEEIARERKLGALEIKAAEDEIYIRKNGAWTKVTDVAALPDAEEHSGVGRPAPSTGADGDHFRRTQSGITAAKAAFAAAVKKIQAVTPLNVPVWKIGATTFATPGATHSVSGREVVIDAIHPAGVTIPGRVAIEQFVKRQGDSSGGIRILHGAIPGDATGARARVRVAAQEKKPVTFEIAASSLCGPTTLTVTLRP